MTTGEFDYQQMIRDPFVQRMMAYKHTNVVQVPRDRTLYRYRSLELDFLQDELFNLVRGKKVYFAGREELNDPMDCFPVVHPGIEFSEFLNDIYPIMQHVQINKVRYLASIGDQLKRDLPIIKHIIKNRKQRDIKNYFEDGFWNDIVNEGVDKMSVCCFTEDNNNDVMWSMYANKGNGICIGLNSWSDESAGRSYEHPIKVIYTIDRFEMNYAKALNFFVFMQPGFLGGIDSSYHETIKSIWMDYSTGCINSRVGVTRKSIEYSFTDVVVIKRFRD